jgi:hypothetical protein
MRQQPSKFKEVNHGCSKPTMIIALSGNDQLGGITQIQPMDRKEYLRRGIIGNISCY